MEIGTCQKHGEFILLEGCPKCLEEKRKPAVISSDLLQAMPIEKLESQIREQINTVVEIRHKVIETSELRLSAYQKWVEENQSLLDSESNAKSICQEAEAKLRELALLSYAVTGEKTVAPGVGIRLMTKLYYENSKAMDWAMEHKLAWKFDSSAFEKLAKVNKLRFVTYTEEPAATISNELFKEG